MRQSIFSFVFLLLLISSHAFAQNGDVVNIDFDTGHFTIAPTSWNLVAGALTYKCVKKGDPQVQPQLLNHAIRIELDPTSGLGPDNGRDKVNYRVVKGSDENAPTFDGRVVYYRFSMMLDPKEFMTPTTGRQYVLAQWWQGAPFGPPLSLQILPGNSPSDNPRIVFAIRNQETKATPSAKIIEIRPDKTRELKRAKWYTFVVGTRFGYHNDAELKVWINGNEKEEIHWKGDMGYNPSTSALDLGFKTGKMDNKPNPRLELYFGPYRDRMDSKQVFYFARVNYSPTRRNAHSF
jgi:Polysaccharide lyase